MNKNIVICPTYSPFGFHDVKCLGATNKVTMSCGGGMGGSRWEEYGRFKEPVQIGKMAEFVDAVTQEVKTINPQYIVKIESVQLVKAVTDVTAHANYGSKSCDRATHTTYYWFDMSDKVIGANSRTTRGCMDNERIKDNIIYTEYTKE